MRTIRTPDPAELSGQVSSGGVDVVALSKVYGRGDTAVIALSQVTVSFAARSFTAVMGPSGSGKTTLLQCAAGLDRPTGGQVWIGGRDIARLRDPRATRFRRSHVGFVFQAFNLLGSLDVAGNIALPIHLAGGRVDQGWMRELVDRVGLAGRMHHRPAELSGGQQQRVAIARALVTRPHVIFADEPTGALDLRSGREILALLREAVDELGRTVVMVTHDPVAAAATDRLCLLADGRLLRDVPDPSAEDAAALFAQLGH